ncbi:MAG: hypothetical protein PHY56_04500 [Candidatus Omnitrophica bacterium]|nr:hypothetical protein [Candidatus Omnitrophota bacterium]
MKNKNRILFILYTVIFIFYYIYVSAESVENKPLVFLFTLLVFAVPIVFVGFHASFLVALAQFINFFWFRLLFRDISGSVVFIVTLFVIPLISLGYNNRLKNIFFRLIYPGLVAIILLFGAELIIKESPLDRFLDMKQRVYNLSARIDLQSNYLINHDKDAVFTDSVGRKFSVNKPRDAYRIICLGSSSTEGHGAGIESYPVRLEEFLKGKIDNVEVINAGAGGIRFYNLYIYFKDILSKLKPDLLVVYFGYNNDSFTVYRYFQSAQEIKRRYPFIDNSEDLEYALNFKFCSPKLLKLYRWLFSSRLFTALKLGLDNIMIRYAFKDLDAQEQRQFKEKNVHMLVDYCVFHSIRLVLVPEVIMYDNGEYAGYFKDVKDELKGIYYFYPQRAGLTAYLTDSIHFNKEGYDNLAYQIGSFILEKDLAFGLKGMVGNGG